MENAMARPRPTLKKYECTVRSAYALIILLLCTYFVIFTKLLISIYGVGEWVMILLQMLNVYVFISRQKKNEKSLTKAYVHTRHGVASQELTKSFYVYAKTQKEGMGGEI